MTKDEFIDSIYTSCSYLQSSLYRTIQDNFKRFLEANVAIPKGVNRHPYADAYHLALEEGINLVPAKDENWYAFKTYPSEPVHEWTYKIYHNGITCVSQYLTDDEFRQKSSPIGFHKIEETKRIRR